MLRLVKGAYWDSEIKRAQVEGLEGFAVFTRKIHTDVAYIACARQLLEAPDAIFPQFATHNALTLATVHAMAGEELLRRPIRVPMPARHGRAALQPDRRRGRDARPCRVYAPVGSHETLLAYLVRRLLENGANTSFVNRIADAVGVGRSADRRPGRGGARARTRRRAASQDRAAARSLCARARRIPPGSTSATRRASPRSPKRSPRAREPIGAPAARAARRGRSVNPGRRRRRRRPRSSTPSAEDVERAFAARGEGRPGLGGARACRTRGGARRRGGALRGRGAATLAGLIVREAGKTLPNALGDVREAVDFLRYYGADVAAAISPTRRIAPLGTVVCISPWNFPIAIFTGQIAAALAAGNAVIAKPAEETPLVAAAAVRLMHEAGVPDDALILSPATARSARR